MPAVTARGMPSGRRIGENMKEVKTNPVELYKCGWDHQWSYKDCVTLGQKRAWLLHCESCDWREGVAEQVYHRGCNGDPLPDATLKDEIAVTQCRQNQINEDGKETKGD